jgi:aminoglycoside phosphotransferase (APT) family kinase protein
MRMPEAEIAIDADLVAALIRQQHPDLLAPLRLITNGWDNVIFRLGDELAVRLPRRQVAARLVENEQRWLPGLAATVSTRSGIGLPVPLRTGRPTADYPWYWSIVPWLPGRPVAQLPVPDRVPLAVDWARFLAAWHRPAPDDAPENPVRGVPLAARDDLAAEHLAGGAVPEPDRLRAVWRRLAATPAWPGPPVWLHGDPHPANALASAGRLTAVIDFGDITAGDPATDLAAGWLVFDEVGRRRFIETYEHHQPLHPESWADTWARARGWAVAIGMALLSNSDDHPGLAAVGRHAVQQVLADE